LNTALVQFSRDRFDTARNRAAMLEAVAGVSGADIVCLPEVWMGAVALSEKDADDLLGELCSAASDGRFTLLTGGLFLERGDKIVDVCHVIGPDGRIAGEQLKIFPSGAVGEREYCRGGGKLEVFDAAGVKFGVAVCVDMFYPEIVRRLARLGARAVFNPANIPEERNALWHSLVRTRAAENTVFAVYVNNTGTEYADGRAVSGGSIAAGPDGTVVLEAGNGTGVLRVDLDLSTIETQRKRWAYLDDVTGFNFEGL